MNNVEFVEFVESEILKNIREFGAAGVSRSVMNSYWAESICAKYCLVCDVFEASAALEFRNGCQYPAMKFHKATT